MRKTEKHFIAGEFGYSFFRITLRKRERWTN
jgi:hypothetical protein